MDFDAWDIDIFYDDKVWLAEPASSITLIEHGDLRQTIEIKLRDGSEHVAFEAHLSKYRKLVPAVALMRKDGERLRAARAEAGSRP